MAVAANFNANQVADRRQQEEVGDQAADDRDAGPGQRFLLHVAMLAVSVRLEQQSGQRGAQRQRIERTDDRRCGDRQGELFIELPADAGHERGRHEHGTQNQAQLRSPAR